MKHRALCLAGLLLVASSCGDEQLQYVTCYDSESAFDIEEVSVLEDAFVFPGARDAVVIQFDTSGIEPGAAWRVKTVEVLLMVPHSQFDRYNGGDRLVVEVYDGDDPRSATRYAVSGTSVKNELSWSQVMLDNPMEASEFTQHRAWWAFDFAETIPETGMLNPRFVVSVAWPELAAPAVGYSLYNRPCNLNWTDYNDGSGWVLNSTDASLNCNWPMFRVTVETITEKLTCGD